MNLKFCLLFVAVCLFQYSAYTQIYPSPSNVYNDAFQQRKKILDESLVKNLKFTNIGPSVMSGRVVDLEVNPDNPNIFYVAYASGGLWKTVNNGQSFTPIFDHQAVLSIGDIAVDWKNHNIWVGTGENNSSRSSYSGNGIYLSTDDGKTWQNKGLMDSQHIGRIILDPNNPNIVYVAAIGHLYSPNVERGVFKTSNMGNTWQKSLFIDENTGVIDLISDPQNPNFLWAAAWQRERKAYQFHESGKASGIYFSQDGGTQWTRLNDSLSGFPYTETCGRIGLSLSKENGHNIIYAVVDNHAERPILIKDDKKDGLTKQDFRKMSKDDFLKLSPKKLKKYLTSNNFPEKYTVEIVQELVKNDKIQPQALADFLEDANAALFSSEKPIYGAEVYRSDNNGKTWQKMNEKNLDALFYSYGYYFGQIRSTITDPNRVFIMGVPIIMSNDAGKTWKSIDGDNMHGDFHALWLDPKNNGHIICGNDGGVNISYDFGKNWIKCNSPAVGQFYGIAYDMEEPFNVYGGLQDNGVWVGSSEHKENSQWHQSGEYGFKSILGGDGMQVAVDQRDNETIYTGFQFGNYFKVNRKNRKPKFISPSHDLGERPLRFNWQTPITLSKFNQDIVYMGANKLYRSMNQGKNWDAISGDLTNGGKPGNVPFGTLTSIHESPLVFGLIYTGSDDGRISVTKDGGANWQDIDKTLPQGLWVSRIQASQFEKSRVYVSLNGYRNDHFDAYLYASEDFGSTWSKIGNDLPSEPINVVKEDPVNAQILYVGTDYGVYVSLDRGQHFMAMSDSLPSVAVHDLIVHPRDHKLVLGTHGRSLYTADLTELEQLNAENLQKELIVFKRDKSRRGNWGNKSATWDDFNTPKIKFVVYAKTAGNVEFNIQDEVSNVLYTKNFTLNAGINYLEYDGTIQEAFLAKYEKFLRTKVTADDSETDVKIEKASNGLYYIKAGKYKIQVKNSSGVAENEWVLE